MERWLELAAPWHSTAERLRRLRQLRRLRMAEAAKAAKRSEGLTQLHSIAVLTEQFNG